jgi:Universal stress protein family
MMVSMTHLLLPFTHGIDVSAINYALMLAQRFDATLVVLSLIRLPETLGSGGPRLEAIQQSKDFLEFVYHKAARRDVPIVRVELYTHNPVRSIRTLAQEMECAGIMLFVRRGAGVLLSTGEMKQLLADESMPLYIVPLLTNGSRFSFSRRLSRWFNR